MIKIALIDYGVGNVNSIFRALEKSGANVSLTNDYIEIMSSDGVLLPGVGAFSYGMERLSSLKLDTTLHEFSATGKPILGICLGMQMLFDSSTEFGFSKGLGLIPGQVLKLELNDDNCCKLPHVSWSGIFPAGVEWSETLLNGIESGEDMYFVHSYYVQPKNKGDILSETIYSRFKYCSTVKRGNVYGCQYHPEKSAKIGLNIIKNFVEICGDKND